MKRLKLIKSIAMIITNAYIKKFRSGKNGWTAQQLTAIGASWPPKKGWIKYVTGKEISPENQIIFEKRTKEVKALAEADRKRSPEHKLRSFLQNNPDDIRVIKACETFEKNQLSLLATLALYVDVRELK